MTGHGAEGAYGALHRPIRLGEHHTGDHCSLVPVEPAPVRLQDLPGCTSSVRSRMGAAGVEHTTRFSLVLLPGGRRHGWLLGTPGSALWTSLRHHPLFDLLHAPTPILPHFHPGGCPRADSALYEMACREEVLHESGAPMSPYVSPAGADSTYTCGHGHGCSTRLSRAYPHRTGIRGRPTARPHPSRRDRARRRPHTTAW